MRMGHTGFGAVVVFFLAIFAATTLADTVAFDVTYGPGYTPARISAFEFAMDRYRPLFEARYPGETVHIATAFAPLGAGVLAGTAPTALVGLVRHPPALAGHKLGFDLNGPLPDMVVTFNAALIDGAGTEYYFGTDGATPGGEFDFVSVSMHEVTHGLGFFSLTKPNGAFFSGHPSIFDVFLGVPGLGTPFVVLPQIARAFASRGLFGPVVWTGSNGIAGNGGLPPRVYTPFFFSAGSSLSHWSEGLYPNDLLSPFIGPGQAVHVFGGRTLGALYDMGWTPVPEPSTLLLAGCMLLIAIGIRRRRRLCARS